MRATDELRKMLDEADEYYKTSGNKTWWGRPIDMQTGKPINVFHYQAQPMGEDRLFVELQLATPAQAIAATLGPVITGDTSDGYHTFNELYHHRAVLFSVIVRDHADLAWKSRAHHDGTMYDGMFIVGIETPQGQATYHYDIDPYWDMFECKELDRAPEWDGHTPDEAIARIATLGTGTCHNADIGTEGYFKCSECSASCSVDWECSGWDVPRFCPNCGRRIEVEE